VSLRTEALTAPAWRFHATRGHRGTVGSSPPFTPENPVQMVTIIDKQRPSSGDGRADQRKNPTTDDKPQAVTVGKRGPAAQIPQLHRKIILREG
jgi:hypothetical protein